jgi:hypothetical protein
MRHCAADISAVHPHLPLSTSFRIPLIFAGVDREKRSTAE